MVSPQTRACSITSIYLHHNRKSKVTWMYNILYFIYCKSFSDFIYFFLPFLSQSHHPEFWFQSVSDPLDGLLLWINDEWPTLTGGQDGCIFSRHSIIWQALVVPGCHSGIICKHEDRIQAVCQGHRDLEQNQGIEVTLVDSTSQCWSCLQSKYVSSQTTVKLYILYIWIWFYLLWLKERYPRIFEKLHTILARKIT